MNDYTDVTTDSNARTAFRTPSVNPAGGPPIHGREVDTLPFLFPVILLIASLIAACGSDEGAEVEAAVRRAVEAYNEAETDAYLALHTDKAIQEEYGVPRDVVGASLSEFIGQPPIEIRSLSNTTIAGDQATVDFEHTQGKVVILERVTLIKAGSDWKLDGFEERPLEIPSKQTRVDILMSEFAFAVDTDSIRDGNIALAIANNGEQDHEAVVARIADGASLAELLPAIAQLPEGETPPQLEEIVAFGAYEPGESGNVIFADRLEPGRYGVFCFFPDVNDPEHTPHAFKGMFSEFSIPG